MNSRKLIKDLKEGIANLEILQTAKIKYQQLINKSKIKDKKIPQSSK